MFAQCARACFCIPVLLAQAIHLTQSVSNKTRQAYMVWRHDCSLTLTAALERAVGTCCLCCILVNYAVLSFQVPKLCLATNLLF